MNRSKPPSPWPTAAETTLRRALAIDGVWRHLLDHMPVAWAGSLGAWRASSAPERVLETATDTYQKFLVGGSDSPDPDGVRQLAGESYRAHSIADAEAWVAARVSPIKLCRSWQSSGWEHFHQGSAGETLGAVVAVPRLAGWGMACRALMLYRPHLTLLGPEMDQEQMRQASHALAQGHDIAWLVEPEASPSGEVGLSSEPADLATKAGASLLAIEAIRRGPASYRIEVSPPLGPEAVTAQVRDWVGQQSERWPWGVQRWPKG